jgi:hypothetical protein
MKLATLILYAAVIPTLVYLAARKLDRFYNINGSRLLLGAICLVFTAAVFVPSPLIHGQETQFFTHVLGGLFVGLLWHYFRPATRKLPWYWEVIALFALVSALGTLNELYELFAYEIGIATIPVVDTSWDLLANTLGVSLYYGIYQIQKALKRLFFSQ